MPITQYIFLRSDLKKFAKGALIAQACHSSVKAIEIYKDHQQTHDYLSNIDHMTKVILKFEEKDIEELKSNLKLNSIDYIVWIEQPENILTSLALRPYEIEDLNNFMPFMRKFKLF